MREFGVFGLVFSSLVGSVDVDDDVDDDDLVMPVAI